MGGRRDGRSCGILLDEGEAIEKTPCEGGLGSEGNASHSLVGVTDIVAQDKGEGKREYRGTFGDC